MKKILALCMAFVMTLSLVACGNDKGNEEIKMTISEFEYACQSLDTDAMLECMDPEVSQPLRAARLALNWITTTDEDIILEMIITSLFGIQDDTVRLDTTEISINSIESKEDTATVACKIKMDKDEGTYEEDANIQLYRDNSTGTWYITSINLY